MYFSPNFEQVGCSMSDSNCCFLICIQVSQEAGKVIWYSHQLKNFPVCCDLCKGFCVVNEADVFLEFSCFLYDPADVGNLISNFSAFCKPSLYTWNFLIHVLLKPSLKDFEYNLANMGNKHSFVIV